MVRCCWLNIFGFYWDHRSTERWVTDGNEHWWQLIFLICCWVTWRGGQLLLTWPGAPGSSCSGRAGCRTGTGSPPTSSSPPSPPCSPPACWRSRRGRSSSPSGSSCRLRRGEADRRRHESRKAKALPDGSALSFFFFFFAGQHFLSCQEEDIGPHPNT